MRFCLPDISVQVIHRLPFSDPAFDASDGRDTPVQAQANLARAQSFPSVSRRTVGPCRGESRPDHIEVPDTRDQGARPHRLRAVWRGILRVNARIEASWVGDFIGVCCLFGLLVIGLFVVGVYQ